MKNVKIRLRKKNDRRMYSIKVDLKNQLQECSSCKEIKSFSEFATDRRRIAYGCISHQCKVCYQVSNPIKETSCCSNCKIEKPLNLFHKNKSRASGHDFYCKECRMKTVKYHYNPEQNRNLKSRYKNQWDSFFNKHYTSNPYCSICNKQLKWSSSDKNLSVHWDHRHGKTDRYRGPNEWLTSRPCSEINIKEWLEFDYGILCHCCNKSLPTNDRAEWVRNVNKYVFSMEEDIWN